MNLRTKKVFSDEWQAKFLPEPETILSFNHGGREIMRLLPAEINDFKESQCIIKKARTHITEDGLSSKFDSETVIPFGSEPSIKRSAEFADGFAKVIMDIRPGKHDQIRYLKTDSIVLNGPWKKIAICRIPVAGSALPELEWQELSAEDSVLFDAGYPFLNCVLEDENGFRFEVGLGDDLWRWNSAATLELCSGNFKVSGSNESITIDRAPIVFEKDAEADKRSWRFKWYFAWSKAPASKLVPSDAIIIDGAKLDVPAAALNSSTQGAICHMSAPSRRTFRKSLRSGFSANDNSTFIITGVEPHTCNTASHLDRPGNSSLTHWDVWDIAEFYVWGNRKGIPNQNILMITPPEGSNAGEYPITASLSRPPKGNISAE
ncbi:MAG: hypothetical protein GY750_02620 [Lentisphaerae bacterium]|nr:hypothetical protein [Lentisphaerota bacterium]MCP4100316.1 hypothetical protein [Lentisphaerota bacterium]